MSIVSRIKAGLTAIGINFDSFLAKASESFKTSPDLIPSLESGHKLTPVRNRSKANSNAAMRRRAGIPHGTSGAKLARRAAEGRVTLRGGDVALYAK